MNRKTLVWARLPLFLLAAIAAQSFVGRDLLAKGKRNNSRRRSHDDVQAVQNALNLANNKMARLMENRADLLGVKIAGNIALGSVFPVDVAAVAVIDDAREEGEISVEALVYLGGVRGVPLDVYSLEFLNDTEGTFAVFVGRKFTFTHPAEVSRDGIAVILILNENNVDPSYEITLTYSKGSRGKEIRKDITVEIFDQARVPTQSLFRDTDHVK